MFSQIWRSWKGIAQKIGNFQARVIFTLIYLIMVAPVAMVLKLLADPLRLKAKGPSFWVSIPQSQDSTSAAKKQS